MAKKNRKENGASSKKPMIIALVIAIVFLIALGVGIALGLYLKEQGVPTEPFSDSDFVNKVFPQGLWDFVIQLSAFVLLILIVFFIGYKPVAKMMKKRQETIEAEIQDAAEKQAIAASAAAKKDETIEKGRLEAERLLAEARAQAQAEAALTKAQAEQEIAARRAQADLDIEAAKRASLEEAREEMVSIALAASGKVLGREVDDEDNRRLVADFVDDLTDEGGRA